MIEAKPWNENILEFERESPNEVRVGSLWENKVNDTFGDKVYILAQVMHCSITKQVLFALVGLQTGNRYDDPVSWKEIGKKLAESPFKPVTKCTITVKRRED
jgi:hypothetical protein